MKKNIKSVLIALSAVSMLFFMGQKDNLIAAVTGECSNCHTMHNSQGGSPMATYGPTGTGPYPLLVRGDCLGCHGMSGASSNIVTVNGSEFPQVRHTDTGNNLAGGNFAFITGVNGDAKGHNVVELSNPEGTITGLPGGITQFNHNDGGIVNRDNLTCAGANGCHGIRDPYDTSGGLASIKGSHHRNEDGLLNSADTLYNSYRFLNGVRGLENPTNRWLNVSSASHNEYYGTSTPPVLGCAGGETSCHISATNQVVRSPNNTMSGFCGTCHGNFHTQTGALMDSSEGIGATGSSPFQRHPSDITIPATGEYQYYTTYDIQAPVGRTTLPGTPDSNVTPGSDVVMCLSCHGAHATDYPDLLRWNYDMDAGAGSDTDGCFVCHTTKDE